MTVDYATVFAKLDALCTRVLDQDGEIPEKYLVPWRGKKGNALAVVAPQSIEEIKSLIELAKEQKLRLLPQGARTGVVGGSVPGQDEGDKNIIVSLEKFRSRLELNETEKKVTVEAGYLLSEVNEYLKSYGVEVPINVSSDPMVGAMAATNIAGARVVKYGDFRNLCAGIEVVLADDDISTYSTLDKPIKDNSSLDFTQLFVGSFGSCGIITAVQLDVVPIVSQTNSAWLALSKNCNLSELIQVVESSSTQMLLACEFVSLNAIRALNDSAEQNQSKDLIPFAKTNNDLVFVEWGSGSSNDLSRVSEDTIAKLIEAGIALDAQIVPSHVSWNIRHRISEAVQNSGNLIGCDISVTKDKFNQLRSECINAVAEINSDFKVCDFGHIGDGGIHMNIVVPKVLADDFDEGDAKLLRYKISQIATELGGSFSAEHGLGSFNKELYEEFTDSTVRYLSQGFKSRCDPDSVLGHSQIVL